MSELKTIQCVICKRDVGIVIPTRFRNMMEMNK